MLVVAWISHGVLVQLTVGLLTVHGKRTSSSRRCADQHVQRQCHAVAKPAAPAHGMDVGHGQVLDGAKSRGGAGSTRKSMLEIAR